MIRSLGSRFWPWLAITALLFSILSPGTAMAAVTLDEIFGTDGINAVMDSSGATIEVLCPVKPDSCGIEYGVYTPSEKLDQVATATLVEEGSGSNWPWSYEVNLQLKPDTNYCYRGFYLLNGKKVVEDEIALYLVKPITDDNTTPITDSQVENIAIGEIGVNGKIYSNQSIYEGYAGSEFAFTANISGTPQAVTIQFDNGNGSTLMDKMSMKKVSTSDGSSIYNYTLKINSPGPASSYKRKIQIRAGSVYKDAYFVVRPNEAPSIESVKINGIPIVKDRQSFPVGPLKIEATASSTAVGMNLYKVVNGTPEKLIPGQVSGNKLSASVPFSSSGVYTLRFTAVNSKNESFQKDITIVVGNPVPIITKISPLTGDQNKTIDMIIEGIGFTGASSNVDTVTLKPVQTSGTTYSTKNTGATQIKLGSVTDTKFTATLPKGVKEGEYSIWIAKNWPGSEVCYEKGHFEVKHIELISVIKNVFISRYEDHIFYEGEHQTYNPQENQSPMSIVVMDSDIINIVFSIDSKDTPDEVVVRLLDASGNEEDTQGAIVNDYTYYASLEYPSAGKCATKYKKVIEICPYYNGQKGTPYKQDIVVYPEMFFWMDAPNVSFDKESFSNSIKWSEYPGANSYILGKYKADSKGSKTFDKTISVMTNSYQDYDIEECTNYYYTIRPTQGSFWGRSSLEGHVITGATDTDYFASRKRFVYYMQQIAKDQYPNGDSALNLKAYYEGIESCAEDYKKFRELSQKLGLLLKAELMAATPMGVEELLWEVTQTTGEVYVGLKYDELLAINTAAAVSTAYQEAYYYEAQCSKLSLQGITTYPEALEFWKNYQGVQCYATPAIQLHSAIVGVDKHQNGFYNLFEGVWTCAHSALPSVNPALDSAAKMNEVLIKGLMNLEGMPEYIKAIEKNQKYMDKMIQKAKDIKN